MSVKCRCLARTPGEMPPAGIRLVHYSPRMEGLARTLTRTHVLLDTQSEPEVAALLKAGIERVYVGDTVLQDTTLVHRLLQQFGPERIGLHVRARRQSVSWSFDTESNADFNVVTPSLCMPEWELLGADAAATGVTLQPWLAQQRNMGVASVVLRVDIGDDADLNICAGMVESFGDLIWFAPLNDSQPALSDWIEFGQVRQLALPPSLFHNRTAWLPKRGDAA